MKKLLLIPMLVLITISCSTNYRAKIESDTLWQARIDSLVYEGSGNRTFDLDDGKIQCVTVKKLTKEGRLKLTILENGFMGFDFMGTDIEVVETYADSGSVSACTH